jgi:cytochrome P450 family 12
MGFESLKYYKQTVRPDIYGEYEGLFTAQEEKWHSMRTIANPILLQPKIVKRYTSQIDDIAKEFVDM